jgi:Lon protease-like protein
MVELPLFPLQSVLFPGMPLRLHIFENRYKNLIQHCLDNQLPFGVVLIARGQEALGPLPEPREIGTTAQISYLEPLGDGRSNLLAIGGERFRILEILHGQPYLRARVEYLEMPVSDHEDLQRRSHGLRLLLERYLTSLSDMDLWREGTFELPREPLPLAYMAGAILQVPNDKKQALLEAASASQFFWQIQRTLRQEIALLKLLAERGMERMQQTSLLN